MTGLLSQGSAPYLYGVIFIVVLGEAIILAGTFIPTFTTLLTAGALASHGSLSLVLVITVAATAVIIGDRLGHLTGRIAKEPPSTLTGRHGRWGQALTRTQQLMSRHGRRAIFLGRFIPVVRTVTPYLTGRAHIPYRLLLPYSVGAALLWAGAETGLGYLAVSGATWLPFHLRDITAGRSQQTGAEPMAKNSRALPRSIGALGPSQPHRRALAGLTASPQVTTFQPCAMTAARPAPR